jgi:hypothetical protein
LEGLDHRGRGRDLEKRLAEAEWENAKLREAVAKMEEELRILGQHFSSNGV